MSHIRTKPCFERMRPVKTQISLRICAVWSESSLPAWRNVTSYAIRNAPSADSDQTSRMRRLIWIFAWRTCQEVRSLKFVGHNIRTRWLILNQVDHILNIIFLSKPLTTKHWSVLIFKTNYKRIPIWTAHDKSKAVMLISNRLAFSPRL